jgi:predicted AAA+ superfamily ATPase
MDKEAVKTYILDFQKRNFKDLIYRDINLNDSKKIQSVIGARRDGKTYLLFQKIIELEKKGVERSRLLYLNFENPALHDMTYKEFKELLGLYFSLYPENTSKKIYLFIDEPQVIDKWEIAIRGIYDEYDYPIFITGSSSKLLSKEIATSLRGRTITTTMRPLSFKEFLRFKGFAYELNKLDTKSKAILLNYFSEFLRFGGYPEVVIDNEEHEKLKILKDYMDLTIYKDIIDRYNIKKSDLLKWMINTCVLSVGKEISLNKIYLDFKSRGKKISKNSVYGHFIAIEDSFFAYALRKLDYSYRNEAQSIPKIYLNDVGFLNLFSMEDYGRRLENAVFMEIFSMKNNNPLLKINYWKSLDDKEVDFVISEGKKAKIAIQVCYSLNEFGTKEREIKSLIAGLNYLNLKEGMILTLDDEGEEDINGKLIRIIPAWKWLLTDGDSF